MIGDEKQGDLMAGFTKAPFYGAAYEMRGIMKGAILMSRAPTQPRVEYASGLLQDVVMGIAKDMLNQNQHEIAKLNAQLATMADGDELADLNALNLKERKVTKGLAINRVLVHAPAYFTGYAEQTRMFDVRDALVELTGVLPRGAQQGDIINIARLYGREMHVLTVLQRVGDVEPVTLNAATASYAHGWSHARMWSLAFTAAAVMRPSATFVGLTRVTSGTEPVGRGRPPQPGLAYGGAAAPPAWPRVSRVLLGMTRGRWQWRSMTHGQRPIPVTSGAAARRHRCRCAG